MRVLVTGSSGRLGATAAALLRAQGCEVAGLDARPGPQTTAVGDVRDADAVSAALAGADALVHTASLHAPQVPLRPKREFVDVNVQGTQALLDAAAAAGVRRVVYTSTTSVYGHALVPGETAVWVDEALVPRPRDVYDVTKLAAEGLCRLFAQEHPEAAVHCLRISRFSFEADPHLAIPYCLHRALHVEDAASAHLLALRDPRSGFMLLNVSGATPFQRDDAAELLRDARAVLRRRDPALAAALRARGCEPPRRIERVYDSARARAELGYRPRHGVLELLAADAAASG